MKFRIGAFLPVLCLLALAGRASATDRVVPAGYPTIQAAIDASVDGDSVVLSPGTYTGAGNTDLDYLGKAITVRSSTYDAADVIIDCAGGPGITFHTGEGSDSVLWGVTVRNGYVASKGMIVIEGASPLFKSCTIRDCVASNLNEAVHVNPGNPTFENCAFRNNSHSSLQAFEPSLVTVSQCSFDGDYRSLFMEQKTTLIVTDTTFANGQFGIVGNGYTV